MTYPGLLHPEPLPLQQTTVDQYLLRRHPNTVLSQSLWGLWVLVHTGLSEPSECLWQVFDSKHIFTPPNFSLLPGLLLCPWMWGISSKLLQHHTAVAPVLSSYMYITICKNINVTAYWLCQSFWLCGSQQTVENSKRDGNTRPPDLPLEKFVCRSRSNN